jgi:hypothetical protein
VSGQTTLHLFLQGSNNFGRDGGERARPLYIYFFEVVMVVRGRDHSTFIFGRHELASSSRM